MDEIVQDSAEHCWAASAQMLTRFFAKNDIEQCAQASAYVKYGSGSPTSPPKLSELTECCNGPAAGCQEVHYPKFPLWSEDVRVSNGCLPSWSELRDQVRGKNGQHGAFAFTIDWGDNNGSHMRVLRGFAENYNGTHLVLTYDPAGPGSLKWDDYGFYQAKTYFTITRVFDQIEHLSPGLPQGDPQSKLGKETWADLGCSKPDPVIGVKPPSSATDDAAAEDGRKIMLWLGKEDHKALGFHSAQEAADTAVDFSLPDDSLDASGVATLANDSTYPDPGTLLTQHRHRYYSINTLAGPNPGPRSLVVVELDSAGPTWRPFEYGNGPLAQGVAFALRSWGPTAPFMTPTPNRELLRRDVVLVELHAVNLHLLYHKPTKRFTLVERFDALPLPGSDTPNAQLFKQLVKLLPKTNLPSKPLEKFEIKE